MLLCTVEVRFIKVDYLMTLMSEDTYVHILSNLHLVTIDSEKGLVTTIQGSNGSNGGNGSYLKVKLKGKVVQVHQIIAVQLFGERCIGHQINHKDGIKTNNHPSNLEVISRKSNIQHAFENGLYKSIGRKRLLDDTQVDFIKSSSLSNKELGNQFSVSTETIRRARNL